MGTDFSLAYGNCLEFIELHKWSIIEDAVRCLVKAHYKTSCQSDVFQLQRIPELSNQIVVRVTAEQIAKDLQNFVPCQLYIKKLIPFVHNFSLAHREHLMFLTCDTGDRPWDFGEPRYLEWKEIKSAWMHSGQYLPRNLIEDLGFRCWDEVLQYYSEHESWFLDEQMREWREDLKQAFEETLAVRNNR